MKNIPNFPSGSPTLGPTQTWHSMYSDPESLVMLCSSIVSGVGSLIIFFSLISKPSCLKKSANQILLYVATSDVINSIAMAFGFVKDKTVLCVVQGIMTNIFALSSILWTTCQALLLYSIIVLQKQYRVTLTVHAVCWGLPMLTTFLIYTTNRIGAPSGYGWCFIADNPDSPYWTACFWNFMSYYAWIIASEGIMVYCLVKIALKIRKSRTTVVSGSTATNTSRNYVSSFVGYLWLYPLVIFVSWTYDGFVDSSNSITGNTIVLSKAAYCVMYLALPGLQGLFTAVIFMLTNKNFRSCFSESKHPSPPLPKTGSRKQLLTPLSVPIFGSPINTSTPLAPLTPSPSDRQIIDLDIF